MRQHDPDEHDPWSALLPGGALYAFSFPNYRLFFFGQLISVAGTWMQTVAEQWLVYDRTHSSVWLGIVSGATALPYVIFAFPGGSAADRFPRRKILIVTQSIMMVLSFILTILATNRIIPVQAWHVAALAAIAGCVNAFNMPAQQAFVTEMVEDPKALTNAIALNSLRFNLARFLGPMLAGIALVKLGAVWCFFLNALSFLAVIGSLVNMKIHRVGDTHRLPQPGSVWEGLRFIQSVPSLLRVVLLIGTGSLLVLSISTLYPVLAAEFGHGASGFSTIVTINGIGATVGGLFVVTFGNQIPRRYLVYGGAMWFCTALLLASLSHSFWVLLGCLFVAGFGMVVFTTNSNTKIQEEAPDDLRGRVMAVYSLVANSLTPVGGLLLGFLAQRLGATHTMRISAIISFGVAAVLFAISQNRRRAAASVR